MFYFTFKRRFVSGLLSGIISNDAMSFCNADLAEAWRLAINEKGNLDYKIFNFFMAYNSDDVENSPIKFSLNPLDDVGGFDLRVEYPQCMDVTAIDQLAKLYIRDFVKDYVLRDFVAFCPATLAFSTEVRFYELAKIA